MLSNNLKEIEILELIKCIYDSKLDKTAWLIKLILLAVFRF